MLAAMNRSLIVTENGPEIIEPQAAFAGEGDTLINVSHSSVNYKDAMALSGNRGILREIPMVPGIDVVGTLEDGTLVTVNGRGLGERRNGGYTPQVRIDDTHITRVPSRFTATDAAAIGTAGYTAALSVAAFERASYEVDGPVLVTGATGGVGSIAVSLLAERGFEVWALTGRVDEHGDWLRELGASDVLDRAEFTGEGKPLRWPGPDDDLEALRPYLELDKKVYVARLTQRGRERHGPGLRPPPPRAPVQEARARGAQERERRAAHAQRRVLPVGAGGL